MMAAARAPKLDPLQFQEVCRLIQSFSGICLPLRRKAKLESLIQSRIGELGLSSVPRYLQHLTQMGAAGELGWVIDALAIHKTSFFREEQHFDYLRQRVLPGWQSRAGRIRLWSAACSSGEEPYSLAILLHEFLTHVDSRDVKILATDISPSMLALAGKAIYDQKAVEPVPAVLRKRYFQPLSPSAYRIRPEVRRIVRLGHLNLLQNWPFRGPFDVIFCRNVMIYFDVAARQRLVRRFWQLLRPGGLLFIGCAESLMSLAHPLRYLKPAVYERPSA